MEGSCASDVRTVRRFPRRGVVRAVAITGVGVRCALGASADAYADALRAHRGGARQVAGLGGLPSFAAVVQGPVDEPEGFADDRKVGLLAHALGQVERGLEQFAPERRGVFLGTGLSSVTPRELEEDIYPHQRDGALDRVAIVRDLATDRVAPRRHMPARATGYAATRIGARGPCGTAFSACAAGSEAIAAAARAISRGSLDVAIAGGHDAMVHPLGILSFEVLGAVSHGQSRPFDRNRDGFLLGEGAAVLRLEAADKLSGPPLAWLLGAGSSIDAHGVTAPHPDGAGAEASMRRALLDAGVAPEEVEWVNAHATGTPLGDVAEGAAIARLLGGEVAVSSLKGAVGHTLAAAGAVEAVATVLALRDGFVPGTYGCEDPDDLGVRVLCAPEFRALGIALSNSFGFGGQNATLVLASPEAMEAR
jgi:3-oxoacyl-(acyl-carrier-protein) synthase